jgi:uncharacterized protein (DUF2252 family)
MTDKKYMKILSISLLLLIALPSFAQEGNIPEETLKRLKVLYPDQSEDFLKQRIQNASGLFSKWRSFPPYFYQLVKRSEQAKLFQDRIGLCAGDPHLENFGFLPLPNGRSVFTLNDLDDATECSLDLDLMRLYLAHKILKKDLSQESFLKKYQDGLAGKSCSVPEFIKKLEAKSVKKGKEVPTKYQKMLDDKKCSGEFAPLTENDKKLLDSFEYVRARDEELLILKKHPVPEFNQLAQQISNQILHACSRTKDSGGSAGEKRFILLMKSASDKVEAIELKPLVKGAPDFNQNISIEKREATYQRSVDTFLGAELKQDYFPVRLGNRSYQRRPLWAGQEAVKKDDIESLSSPQQLEVMNFETCRLGELHRLSHEGPFQISPSNWEKAAAALLNQFQADFAE